MNWSRTHGLEHSVASPSIMFCHIDRAYRSTLRKGCPRCAPVASSHHEDYAPSLCSVRRFSWAKCFRFLFWRFCSPENGCLALAVQNFLSLERILFHLRFLFVGDLLLTNLKYDLLDLWTDGKGLPTFRCGQWFVVQGLLFVSYIYFAFSFCFLGDQAQALPFSCTAIAACFDLGWLAALLLPLISASRHRLQDHSLRSMDSRSTGYCYSILPAAYR